jgi:vancomycin resistance protein YoaR
MPELSKAISGLGIPTGFGTISPMRVYPAYRRNNPVLQPLFLQITSALAGGFALFLVFSLVLVAGFSLLYTGKIYPGVSVAGVSLGGLTPEDAAAQLAAQFTFPNTGKIVFQDGSQVWIATPAELGLNLDAQSSAQAAYQWGRSGGPLTRLSDRYAAWHGGRFLSPVMLYNETAAQQYLDQIVSQVNRPTVEASLSVNGTEVVVVPGQVGRSVDIQATLAELRSYLPSMTDGLIPLEITEASPAILDTSQQAEVARRILSAPLTLKIPDARESDPGPWVIPPDQLAEMLTIQRVNSAEGARYQIALDGQILADYLGRLSPDIDRLTSNPRFTFNDDTRLLEVIQPAVIGRSLDVPLSVQEINRKLLEGEHSISLVLKITQPDISDTATAEQLGIKELIISYTSYFRGSTKERMQNIQTAAANFHGLLVPPGAVFSMADVMGSVDLDTGYAEAWIIYGGRTIKGVGGGVCQVSTTLFRTAFFAGLPIIERYAHAYRVSYYEQTRTGTNPQLAGLDATVFVPVVDFKFQNDTPYYLLMETYFNPTSHSLTWKFYSTSDGRTVEWDSTGLQNIVDPPDPVYEENTDLAAGVIRQVDWAAAGADVTVTRRVYRAGQLLYEDAFSTHYLPWADVYQYGPGTELPVPS